MYDATCTTWQASTVTTLASTVNGVAEVGAVTAQDFTSEAKGWGLHRRASIVKNILERISVELDAIVLDATIDEEMVDRITARTSELLDQAARLT